MLLMVIYSHSRLSSFEQCPLKFKYRYIDKIIPEIEKSIELHLGSSVHDALEWLYKSVIEGRIPTIDEVITRYAETWQKTFVPNIKIVRHNLTDKDYFNKGIQFLLDYYMRNKPFNDGTVSVEDRILIKLDEEFQIQGFIDRLVHNTKTNIIEIHDYKTANSLPPQEKFETDRQLALYSIAIKEKFGNDKKVLLVWHYLAHNTKIISTRTNEQLKQLKQETLNLIKEIESTTEFPSKKSILCDWCEYKSMCPEFGGIVKEIQKKL